MRSLVELVHISLGKQKSFRNKNVSIFSSRMQSRAHLPEHKLLQRAICHIPQRISWRALNLLCYLKL